MSGSADKDLSIGPASGQASPRVVLASASAYRARMLRAAGVAVTVSPPAVDEAEVKASFRDSGRDGDGGIHDVAAALAELKALHVSTRQDSDLVIGADQMLDSGGVWFDKPVDMDHAREQLQALRGRTHRLVTAACIARDGAVIWCHTEEAHLTVRDFSDAFLDRYLAAMGEEVLTTVGGYQLEGLGAQLITRVKGGHFVVLGLPLLAVLDCLRTQKVLIP